jgi:hypothetical protein
MLKSVRTSKSIEDILTFTHPSEAYCKQCPQWIHLNVHCIRKEHIVITINVDSLLKILYPGVLTTCRGTREDKKYRFGKFRLYHSIVVNGGRLPCKYCRVKLTKEDYKSHLVMLITSSKSEEEITYLKDILRRFSKQKVATKE